MLREIEQNFFHIAKSISRDKRQTHTEHNMVVGKTHRDNNQRGCSGHHGQQGKGRGRCTPHHPQVAAATANAAQQQSSVICYKCGKPGHIATVCTTNSTQCPCTAPTAHGNTAAVQEGDSTGTGNTRTTSCNALVCMARAIQYEQAMSARRILNYNANPNLCQPTPQPIPIIETATTGTHLFCTD